MSSLTTIPKQSYFSAQLQSPIDASQTTGIILTDSPDFTPGGITIYFNILDAGRVETISATGWTANELTGVTRAVATYSGETAVGYAHGAGVTVVLSDDWKYFEAVQTAVNSKFDTAGGTITGATAFSGASTTFKIPNLTTAEKNALTPANGMLLYDTTLGEFQYYDGGAWNAVGTASVSNASTTVAGIVELATAAQRAAGTATGETGAALVPSNDALVKTSSGAGDENKLAVLDSAGKLAMGFIDATATPTASKIVLADGTGKIADGWLSTTALKFGGTGADGALSVTSGTTTIDLASAKYVVKNYTSINVSAGATLTFQNPHSTGTVIVLKSQGNVTVAGTIDASGMGAAGGAGGAALASGTAGTQGAAGTTAWGIIDGTSHHGGQAGTTGSSVGGGAAGAIYTNKPFYLKDGDRIFTKSIFIAPGSGGAGGQGGAQEESANYASAGGNGGNGGGGLLIEVFGALDFSGTINVNGANGSNGEDRSTTNKSCAAGGGGSGGAAGMAAILYNTLTANTGTITSAGGSSGRGGNCTQSGAGAGICRAGAGGGGAGAYGGAGGTGGNGRDNTAGNGNSGTNAGSVNGASGGGGGGAATQSSTSNSGGAAGTNGTSDGGVVVKNTEF